jgi:hypothetical protein
MDVLWICFTYLSPSHGAAVLHHSAGALGSMQQLAGAMQGTEAHDVHGADAGAARPSGFTTGGAGPSSGATGRPKRAAAQQVLLRRRACFASQTANSRRCMRA